MGSSPSAASRTRSHRGQTTQSARFQTPQTNCGCYREELRDSPGTSLELVSTIGIGAFRNGNSVDQPIHDAGSHRQGLQRRKPDVGQQRTEGISTEKFPTESSSSSPCLCAFQGSFGAKATFRNSLRFEIDSFISRSERLIFVRNRCQREFGIYHCQQRQRQRQQ